MSKGSSRRYILSDSELLKQESTRYYKCVSCAYIGDFGYVRKKSIQCQDCGYDLLTGFDYVEYQEARMQRGLL